jgi:Mrp family chromosome partitioning ATPase
MSEISVVQLKESASDLPQRAVVEANKVASHYSGEVLLKVSKKSHIDPRIVCWSKMAAQYGENYYGLRLAVENMHQPGRGTVVGITSAGSGEGKTLTAINLAGALALDPAVRVLLIDLDLRSKTGGVSQYMGLSRTFGPGLIDAVRNNALRLEQVVHYIPDFNLYLMVSGGTVDAPYELLRSPRLAEVIASARQRYDYVIIDTTKIVKLPDTALVSRCMDGFLVVVRESVTRRGMLAEALDSMRPESVLGLVFNAGTLGDR